MLTEAQRLSYIKRSENLGPEYIVNENGCWIWQRSLLNSGYGTTGKESAHRYYYKKLVGAIPQDKILDHTCHNADKNCVNAGACIHRRCVNPEHLEPVTHRINSRRGRVYKLTDTQREEIRSIGKRMTLRGLARKFDVSHRTIWIIQNIVEEV